MSFGLSAEDVEAVLWRAFCLNFSPDPLIELDDPACMRELLSQVLLDEGGISPAKTHNRLMRASESPDAKHFALVRNKARLLIESTR